MSAALSTPGMLGSVGMAVLSGAMAITGGVAVSVFAASMLRVIASAGQMRSAHRRVHLLTSGAGRASASGGTLSPWIPIRLARWASAPGSPVAVRLTRRLAGSFAQKIETRLQQEPAASQLVDEGRRFASRAAVAAGACGAALTLLLSGHSSPRVMAAGSVLPILGAVLGARLPWVMADRWLARRTAEAAAELPVLIDTVSLCTRAGMSFDQSLELYSRRFDGRLSSLLIEASDIWRSGISTRSRELDRLGARLMSPAVEGFFSAVIQSIDLGTPLAAALDAQAAELRAQRHAALEERISKLPVKMLIPIGLFTLPAMLILLLAPIALQVIAGFG